MFRIGICDDDIAFGCQMEEYLKEYARKENIEINIEVFLSGEDYLESLKRETALDVLFLDIELGKRVNGVMVGRLMRSDLANEVTQIVYVSANESYAMQLFRNRPMDFLVKPVKMEDVERVMAEYRRIFFDRKMFFEFRIGKITYRTSDDEILYFQCSGKKIGIVTSKEYKEYYGTMAEVEKQVDPDRFWTIHKSYIVNINYVSEFRVNGIVMVTGDVLPISRAYQKKVQEKLLRLNMSGRRYK